ncbi:hypothetical protein CCR75_000844 [Bremia lactucae]|uniref:Man1/Src1-like C-terminal domain-containing protein n=1 Tax=Bremia lactucae TaxID=4779 RepID=A0A976FNT2_BRELC|nr:hypothetical protein CCR75_000844 [Bremia lactucae]
MEQRRLKPSLSTKRKAPFVAAYSSTKRRRQQPAPGGFPAAAATVSKHKLPYSNPTKPTKVTNSGNTNERKPPLFSRYADPSVQSPKPIKNKYNTIAKTVASRQSMEPQEVDLSTLLDITRLETVEGDEILNTMLRVGKPRGLRQFPAEELLTNSEQRDRETLRRRRQKLRLQYSMMKEHTEPQDDARIRQSLVPKAPDIVQDCAFQTQETDERARLEEEEAETDEESTESKIHRLSTAMHLKWRQCWRWFVSGAFLLCVVVMTAPLIEQILAPPLPFCDSDWIEAFDESFGVVASPDDFDRSKALAPFLQTTLTRKCQPCPVYGNCLNGSVISCGHPYLLKYQTCLENPVAQHALNELAQAMQAFIAKKATEIVCNTSSFSNSLYERDLFNSRRHESVTVPVLLSDVQKFVSSTISYAKAVSMLPSTYVFHRALDLALRDLEHVSVTEDQTQLLVSEHVVPWSCRATRRLYAHIKVIALAMALGTMLVFGYRHFLLCRIERQVVDRFVKEVRYFLLDRTRSFDCSYSSDQLRDDLFKKQSMHDRAWLTTCVWPQVVAIVNRDARIRTRILKYVLTLSSSARSTLLTLKMAFVFRIENMETSTLCGNGPRLSH